MKLGRMGRWAVPALLAILLVSCDGDGGGSDASGGGSCDDGRGTAACAAMEQAVAACDHLTSVPAECAQNLRCCTVEDAGKWKARFDCLAQQCAGGASETVAEDACSDLLEGVSWGCNPSGGGI